MENIKDIISEIYQVGGSVRDEILGKTPKDYDYTTPLTPDEIELAIKSKGKRAYLTGKRFGTIGCKLNGNLIEITTFRKESYASKSRKPVVEYVTNLKEDLSRRDFTINSMAKDMEGKIIDYFGGIDDINNKIIRCVGKPKERFKDDPLRILRACRFASQLGFKIESETEKYINKMKFELLNVSKERWINELNGILLSDNPKIGLNYLMENDIFNVIIPELSIQYNLDQENSHHTLDLWNHTLSVIDNLPKDLILRWAGLFHDIGKPFVKKINKNYYYNYIDHEKVSAEIVLKYASYFKMSNEWKDTVYDLVLNHMKETSPLKEADNKSK